MLTRMVDHSHCIHCVCSCSLYGYSDIWIFRNVDWIIERESKITERSINSKRRFARSKFMWVGTIRLDFHCHIGSGKLQQKEAIEETYANTALFKTVHFKLIIFVGKTVNATLNADIHQEFRKHRDMVVGDFIDTFRTLSLKLIFGLKWISQYCNKVPYIIKVDDDAFVNIFEIQNLIQQHSQKKNFIMCAVLDYSSIYRWKQNNNLYCQQIKVCVDDDFLPGLRTYPRYCNGQMFVFPNELLQPLVNAIYVTPYFWLDDVTSQDW